MPRQSPPNKCPAKEPSCKGPHLAWSRSCPKFKEVEVTEKNPVLPVKIIDEPSELTEPADIESDPAESETPIAIIRTLIAFMTKALFDLFPLQKAKIHAILKETSNPFSILPDEVEALIKILKNRKAPGPDNPRTPRFKHLPKIAIEAVTIIFNNCLQVHHFPPAWKYATTIMIPKPGKDPTNPQSYRPISLLNIAG
jgi:hypothetical protein